MQFRHIYAIYHGYFIIFLFLVFWKNLNSSKSNIFVQTSGIHAVFEGILDHFMLFSVWVQARGALRDLKYFFSTNNLRIVKQMPASSMIICAVMCGKFHSHKIRAILYKYTRIYVIS